MAKDKQNIKEYKSSPIGMIPKDWNIYRLEQLGEFKNGINKSKEDFGFGVPFINLMDIFGRVSISENLNFNLVNATEGEISNYNLKGGDVLFIRSSVKPSGVGLTSVITKDLNNIVYSGFIIRFRQFKQLMSLDFKKYIFHEKGFRQRLTNKSSISANTNINQDSLSSLEIAIPPLPEQRKITQILSAWDVTIETLENLIKRKERNKKALMQQLLTGKKRFKEFKGEKWKNTLLGKVVEFSNGKAHENLVVEDGKYILVTSKFVSTDGGKFRSVSECLSPLLKNDVVMVMSDIPNGKALAKCHLIRENNIYALNQRIGLLRSNGDIDPVFLFYVINRHQYFLDFDSGVGQTNLRKEDILNCPIILPSIAEQSKIISILLGADEEIQVLKTQLEHSRQEKKGLMQVLLTGKKRLNLD